MSRLILIELVIFILAAISSLLGIVDIQRVGQVLLALGIINLVLAVLAWIRVPFIRGDISMLEPITCRELEVVSPKQDTSDLVRPSVGLVARTAGIGIIAIFGGLLWIFLVT